MVLKDERRRERGGGGENKSEKIEMRIDLRGTQVAGLGRSDGEKRMEKAR